MALNRFDSFRILHFAGLATPSAAEQFARGMAAVAKPSAAEQFAKGMAALAKPSAAEQFAKGMAALAKPSAAEQLAKGMAALAKPFSASEQLAKGMTALAKPSAAEQLARSITVFAQGTHLNFASQRGVLWTQGLRDVDPGEILKPRPTRAEREHGVTTILRALDELAEAAPQEDPDQSEWVDSDTPPPVSSNEHHVDARMDLGRPRVPLIPRRRIVLPSGPRIQSFSPIRLFIGAAAEDKPLRDALLNHISLLRQQGLVEAWDEDKVRLGDDASTVIWDNFQLAQIVLLLLSADFIAHKYDHRMEHALEEKVKSATVVPVLVRDVDLTDSVFDHKIRPVNTRPVVRWRAQDHAWKKIAQEVRTAVEHIRAKAAGLIS
jgi:hypothetical protein